MDKLCKSSIFKSRQGKALLTEVPTVHMLFHGLEQLQLWGGKAVCVCLCCTVPSARK